MKDTHAALLAFAVTFGLALCMPWYAAVLGGLMVATI